MEITVVVPTYRRPQILRRTLAALLANELAADDYEVVVVDDADDPETAAAVERFTTGSRRVAYIANPGSGAAAARNAGARYGEGRVLLFLDDDMRVDVHHLERHLETHAAHPRAAVGGDRWYSPESLSTMRATAFGRYRVALEVGYAEARGERRGVGLTEVGTLPSFDLSITREAFWDLGGFDESFPYAGAEDQDLSKRAVQSGLTLFRNHDIRLLHDDATTTLRSFALREERGAYTVVALVRRFPEYLGEFYKNDPVTRDDPPKLVLAKLAKSVLSRNALLQTLHLVAESLERAGSPDNVLRPVYRLVIGLHIFRGYRAALRTEGAPGGRAQRWRAWEVLRKRP